MANILNNLNDFRVSVVKDLKIGSIFAHHYYAYDGYMLYIKYANHDIYDVRNNKPNIMVLNGADLGCHGKFNTGVYVSVIYESVDEEDLPLVDCFNKNTVNKFDEDIFKEICRYFYDKYILQNKKAKKPNIYYDLI